jgi:GAF domain
MSRGVASDEDLKALLDTAARAISETLGFGSVVINVYRPAWDDLVAAAVESDHPGAREQLLGSTLHIDDLAPILDERHLYHGAYMARVSAEELAGVTSFVPPIPTAEDWETWGPDDWLCVPMRDVLGSLIGLLSVDAPPGLRRPGPDAVRLLVSYTSCVTVALETAQRSQSAARHQAALEALLDISGRIARSSFDDLMQTVCAGVRDALGFEKVAVQMSDAHGVLSWRSDSTGWFAPAI